MKIKAELDLSKMWAGREWDEAVADLVREEMRLVVKKEIRAAVKTDAKFKRAVMAAKNHAVDQLLDAMTEPKEARGK